MSTVVLSLVLRFCPRCRQWFFHLCYVFVLDADSGFMNCAMFLILDADSGFISFAMFLSKMTIVALSVVLRFCLRCQ